MDEEQFLITFNEYYPFERYILKNQLPINYLFDDLILTELFVPSTEVDSSYAGTGMFYLNTDDIFIKAKTKKGDKIRLAFYDFSDGSRETIQELVLEDFGVCEWESLYVEHENKEDNIGLREVLLEQKSLIESKYSECRIKDNFKIESTITLLNSY